MNSAQPPSGRIPGPLPTGPVPGPGEAPPEGTHPSTAPSPDPSGSPDSSRTTGGTTGGVAGGAAGTAPTTCWPTVEGVGGMARPFHRPDDFPTTVGNDGRIAWALGLLGLIGFPGLGAIATGLTMLIVGLLQRRKNPVAARVGRRAAIFGATLVGSAVLFFSILLVGLALDPTGGGEGTPTQPLMAVFVPLGIWMIVLGPLIAVIMGIIALVRPVSREKAATILATTDRRRQS